MEKLASKEYWDSVHQQQAQTKPTPRSRAKRALERVFGARGASYFRRYVDYLLWDVVLDRHLPRQAGLKAVEIGSAPGWFMVRLQQRFGYDVWGVEYAAPGVETNRKLFAAQGLNPAQVVHSDFFAEEFQREYAGKFDVVISRGFIEHFDDPRPVVQKHLDLLAPGGTLVISVPNKRGVNHFFTWLFHRQSLKLHNLSIMKKSVFETLFALPGLERRCCTYIGTFSFDQYNTPPGSPMRPLLAVGRFVQIPLNALFRLLAPRGGLECGATSPHLVYVGVKAPCDGGRGH